MDNNKVPHVGICNIVYMRTFNENFLHYEQSFSICTRSFHFLFLFFESAKVENKSPTKPTLIVSEGLVPAISIPSTSLNHHGQHGRLARAFAL